MEDLAELNDLIHGRGKWGHFGKGITTYPNYDDSAKKLHAACLELEKRGEIVRHNENDEYVVWKPASDV